MRRKLWIGVPAVVVLFLIAVAMMPSDFRLERTVVVKTTMEAAFQQANDFHKSNVWNAWMQADPGTRVDYSGAAFGSGAVTTWEGNSSVGAGRMTIEDSTPNARVQIKNEYFKPFAGLSRQTFAFRPVGGDTQVNWVIEGKAAFFPKVIGVFMSMDRRIGAGMEKSLAQLKNILETQPQGK